MLFKVANRATGRSTHCSVLEFVAQEGHVYLPRWVSRVVLGGGGARRAGGLMTVSLHSARGQEVCCLRYCLWQGAEAGHRRDTSTCLAG
jgi:hypothetical protein